MRVAYVLAEPQLSGGVKVVFQHAALLLGRGHDVTVVADGPRPPWFPFTGRYVDVWAGPPRLPPQDLAVATYWTTFARAAELGPTVHFCQGYEGALDHLSADHPAIEAAYRRMGRTFVVAPHLARFLRERFGREARLVPPPLDRRFRPRPRLAPDPWPWIAVPGIFEAEVKGVRTALAAVTALRAAGVACRVLRVSALPRRPEERALVDADRYLEHADPAVVAEAVRRCDLLLSPALAGDGFGLPVLEALASGVPVVAADTPAARFVTSGAAALVPPGDPAAMAAAAAALLGSPLRWHRARLAGWRAAGRFHPSRIAAELERGLAWATG